MPEPSAAPVPNPRLTWRRCVMLCLPALLLGVILRLSFMAVLPECYYGSDSNSYYDTTSFMWCHGKWDLGIKRRWLYPLLLLPTPALPGRNVVNISILQHALGLATLLGIGWIVMHLTRRPGIWVPLVTSICALWPRMVWHEHEVLAEPVMVASFVLAVALIFPIERFREPRRLFWFLMAAALIVAVKPHGRPFWLGLMIVAVILAGLPWRWGKPSFREPRRLVCLLLVAALIVAVDSRGRPLWLGLMIVALILASMPLRWSNPCWAALALSVLMIRTTGSANQGPWLLLSSAFPLVNTEKGEYLRYRQILRPYVEEARADIPLYAWKQMKYKKMLVESGDTITLGPEWQALVSPKDKTKFLKVCGTLAKDAIIHSPLTYMRMVLQKIGVVLTDDQTGYRMAPRVFWKGQVGDNVDRWAKHPEAMRLLYGMDQPEYQALADRRINENAWYIPFVARFSRVFNWMNSARDTVTGKRSLQPAWFGILALFGFITCLFPSRWRETSPLWIPLVIFLAIIFGIGDSLSRYLQPIDWIGVTFVALGLDWVLAWIWRPKSPTEEEARDMNEVVTEASPS